MLPVTEIEKWLEQLPTRSQVGVDEGGLTLLAVCGGDTVASLEIGGLPEDDRGNRCRYYHVDTEEHEWTVDTETWTILDPFYAEALRDKEFVPGVRMPIATLRRLIGEEFVGEDVVQFVKSTYNQEDGLM